MTYETAKRVKIKDPAIGILRLVLIFGCFLYFCLYRVWWEASFWKREQVAGIVQTSLQHPQSWENTSTAPGVDSQPYCADGDATTLSVLPCITGPDAWVMAPSEGGADLFIATRLKEVAADGKQLSKSFVLLPEEYTVGVTFTAQALTHFFHTRDPSFSKSVQDLETTLVDHDGNVYPDGITRIQRFDVIRVKTLLHAAGIDTLDAAHPGDETVSTRYDGLTLLVSIHCPMEFEGSFSSCEYKAEHIYQSVAETFVVTDYANSVSGGSGSATQERRGISLKFRVSGEMGRFDLATLILAWISSLALVEICTFFIDWSMTYLLPYRGIYRMVLYDESPNIQDLRKGDKKAERGVKNLHLSKLANQGEISLSSGKRGPGGSGEGTPLSSKAGSNRATPRADLYTVPESLDRVSPASASTYTVQADPSLQQQGQYFPQQDQGADRYVTGTGGGFQQGELNYQQPQPHAELYQQQQERPQLEGSVPVVSYRDRAPSAISTTEEGPESELL